MAGRASNRWKTQTLPLDYESSARERHAQLISALKIAGLAKLTPLARLVCNLERPGEPLAWPLARYADEFGCSERTVQRWLATLHRADLLIVVRRPCERGGQRTNLVSIHWSRVREMAVDQGDKKMSPRPHNLSPRPHNLSPPYKEYPSSSPSLSNNTSSSTALPHAAIEGRSEEEVFLQQLIAQARKLQKRKKLLLPRGFESALRTALAAGCTVEQLRQRCKWFLTNQRLWPCEFRAGALHDGLRDATPDLPADFGWPYQHGHKPVFRNR